MDERDKKTELLVGLFLFVGLIMLALLILQFGSVRSLMAPGSRKAHLSCWVARGLVKFPAHRC